MELTMTLYTTTVKLLLNPSLHIGHEQQIITRSKPQLTSVRETDPKPPFLVVETNSEIVQINRTITAIDRLPIMPFNPPAPSFTWGRCEWCPDLRRTI